MMWTVLAAVLFVGALVFYLRARHLVRLAQEHCREARESLYEANRTLTKCTVLLRTTPESASWQVRRTADRALVAEYPSADAAYDDAEERCVVEAFTGGRPAAYYVEPSRFSTPAPTPIASVRAASRTARMFVFSVLAGVVLAVAIGATVFAYCVDPVPRPAPLESDRGF